MVAATFADFVGIDNIKVGVGATAYVMACLFYPMRLTKVTAKATVPHVHAAAALEASSECDRALDRS